MSYRINTAKTAAVSSEAVFMPMHTCPRAVKVILLGAGGVATIGQYNGPKDDFWIGWHPLPKKGKEPCHHLYMPTYKAQCG